MEALQVSKNVIFNVLDANPNGLFFNDRLIISDPTRDTTRYELMVIPKAYVSEHPWDYECQNTISWLTEAIADILVRHSKFGLDIDTVRALPSVALTFERNEGIDEKYRLEVIKEYCKRDYGVRFEFAIDKTSHVYAWHYSAERYAEWIYISILKIDVNYVVLTEFLVD